MGEAITTLPEPIKGLTEGRMVHFVLRDGPSAGQHRPAIIVRVWNKTSPTVQLQVFTDDANDRCPAVMWATSVPFDADGQRPYSWHWIEPA